MKRLRKRYAALILALPVLATLTPAFAESHDIDPRAEEILQSVSSYMGGLQSFSVNAAIENEVITDNGQKLQYVSDARLAIERPAKLHFSREGPLAEVETISDGKTFTLHSKRTRVYIQREAPATIDDIIRMVEFETGMAAPGADLMFSDAFSILQPEIVEAAYIGTAKIDGVESHHLAFRGDQADWQLWVKLGPQPLPTKYVITSKWLMGAPQFVLRFHDWNTEANFSADEFRFSAAQQAQKIDVMPVDLMEAIEEEQQ